MMRWLLRLSAGALLVALLIWLWNRVNQDLEEEEDLDDEIPFEFDVPLDVAGSSPTLASTTDVNGDAGAAAVPASAAGLTTMPVEASVADAPDTGGDDLTAIKGIGPAYSAHLAEMGITTYGALIATPVDTLTTAFPRVPDAEAESWITQARELSGPQG